MHQLTHAKSSNDDKFPAKETTSAVYTLTKNNLDLDKKKGGYALKNECMNVFLYNYSNNKSID